MIFGFPHAQDEAAFLGRLCCVLEKVVGSLLVVSNMKMDIKISSHVEVVIKHCKTCRTTES